MAEDGTAAATAAPPPLRALLIGVDRYLQNGRSGIPKYPSLHGSVRDVELVDRLLTGALEVPPERIRKLISPLIPQPESPEPPPTHANLVAALQCLEAECAAGDQALVYYSGHGGRTPTARPDLKGPGGRDECLVPMDIAHPTVGYVRDLEINAWLARMEAKGVFVTLVLDCCHSGGIPRKNRRFRGIDEEDRSPRPTESALAGHDEITATWKPDAGGEVGEAVRSVRLPDRKLLRPSGYTLLAACRPQELAIEDSIDGGPPCGALTHYLLAALRSQGRGATYRQLHAGLVARVHTRYPGQTPMLEGEGDRLILGRRELPAMWGVNVLAIRGEGDAGDEGVSRGGRLDPAPPDAGRVQGEPVRLLLNTGAAQGIGKGARFAVYPASARDAAEPGARLAIVEVEEVGATTSWARIDERLRREPPIREGDQAQLVDPGPVALTRRVELVAAEEGDVRNRDALERVAAQLRAGCDGLLTLCPIELAGDFQVSVDAAGFYRIADAAGRPVPNLGPPLAAQVSGSPEELVRRLSHLARYSNLHALDNPDPSSPLRGRLRIVVVPLAGDPAEADAAHLPIGERSVSGEPEVSMPTEVIDRAWVQLTLHNDSPDLLNVAVLDLQPDWGVCQIFPAPSAGSFHPLDSETSISVPLQAFLPEGLETGTDVLKAFASTGPASFRWLELPALGARITPAGSVRGPTPVAHEWVTSQVELRVVAAER